MRSFFEVLFLGQWEDLDPRDRIKIFFLFYKRKIRKPPPFCMPQKNLFSWNGEIDHPPRVRSVGVLGE